MKIVQYEYAGFVFDVMLDDAGRAQEATAVNGQHPAAYKHRHRVAALECYRDDSKEDAE